VSEVNDDERDATSQSLFSMVASDNAEVIPQDPPRGPETMWSVAANPFDEPEQVDEVTTTAAPIDGGPFAPRPQGSEAPFAAQPAQSFHEGDMSGPDPAATDATATGHAVFGASAGAGSVADDEPVGGDPGPPPYGGWQDPPPQWDTASSPFRRSPVDAVGSIFSAEPVDHVEDLWETDEDDAWSNQQQPTGGDGSLFSNGSHLGPTGPSPSARRRAESADARSVRDTRGAGSEDPWVITDRRWDDSGVDWWGEGGRSATGAQDAPRDGWADLHGTGPEPVAVDDPHGFETAILRLHPQDRERAHVPLSVCGALLDDDEDVKGVVTGQMLGRPAAVVVTGERVLVVNDRRWQPVVDVFRIDAELVVRGRHDRHVAALSFADATRVSMVDGISEVLIAIELAGHIRDAGTEAAG